MPFYLIQFLKCGSLWPQLKKLHCILCPKQDDILKIVTFRWKTVNLHYTIKYEYFNVFELTLWTLVYFKENAYLKTISLAKPNADTL